MNWMSRWPGPFPLFGRSARGSRITDADGHEYIDLCPGVDRHSEIFRAATAEVLGR